MTRNPQEFCRLPGCQWDSRVLGRQKKNISKGIQEMPILQKGKSLKDNSPPKDRLLSKGENSDETLFFPEEKTKNISIMSSMTLSEMERKYLTLFEFIYRNTNGNGYYQTSTESIYARIIITK